jgi:aldose 1-epimerase
VIRHGDREAAVVEVGGALRRFTVGGVDVLDGYDIDDRCTGARGQTLLPWPNRLRDGAYSFGGDEQQLPLSEPGKHNAIHGLIRWTNFDVAELGDDSVTMVHVLHPQPGYPFMLDVRIAYRLGPEGLTVTTTAANLGGGPAPYGTGAHPYLRLPMPAVNGATLQAPGAVRLVTDDRGIPVDTTPVDGTSDDFRTPQRIGDAQLDTGFTSLVRDSEGRAWVRLSDDEGNEVALWCDDRHPFLMLFTGDSLPQPSRRRTGLGVEPMTCAPNAFQSGDGLVTLQPGERHTSTWGITA